MFKSLSLPTRERELKFCILIITYWDKLSLPTRERELKYQYAYTQMKLRKSLPTRERELKFKYSVIFPNTYIVAPYTGA